METRRFARFVCAGAAILAVSAPPLAIAAYIWKYAVTGAYQDEFNFIIPLFKQLDTGQLTWWSLFEGFNEHLVAVARPIFLILGLATGYSNRAFLWVNWSLFVLIAWIWFLDFKQLHPTKTRSALVLAFAPAVWLVFCARQLEMFDYSMTLCEMLSLSGTVLTFHLLCHASRSRRLFLCALVSAIVASGSSASALLAWPIGLGCLIWLGPSPETRRGWPWRLAAWSITGVLVCSALWASQHRLVLYELKRSAAQSPWKALEFLLCLAGAPLGWSLHSVEVIGLLLLVSYPLVFWWLLRRSRETRHLTIALPLIVFSAANLLLLVVGRLPFGVDAAFWPRFTSFTLQGIIGTYLGLTTLAGTRRLAKIMRGGLLAVIVVGTALAMIDGFKMGPRRRTQQLIVSYHLRNYRNQPDSLLGQLFPAPRMKLEDRARLVREGAEILEDRRMNVFAQAPQRPPTESDPPSQVAIDNVNGKRSGQGTFLIDSHAQPACEIRGWAVDLDARTSARSAFLKVGDLTFPVLYGLDRADVARHYANPNYRFSGFYVSFATDLLGPGSHHATLLVVGADGKAHRGPPKGFSLTVE